MLVFIIVSILVLQFFAFSFNIKIKGHINFYANDGSFKVYVFGIRVFKAHTFLRHDNISNSIIIEHGKRAEQLNINNDPKDKKSIMKIIKNPALNNVLIRKIDADFVIGRKNNAFSTSMILSGIKIVSYSVMSFLKSRYKLKINESFEPKFNDNFLEAEIFSIISFSLADIISATLFG